MIVFACNHDSSVVGKRHVVALVVFDGALQSAHQLATSTEHCQVEVVVIVGNNYLAVRTNTDADRIIGHTLAANDSQWSAVIGEHLKIKQHQYFDLNDLTLKNYRKQSCQTVIRFLHRN